MDTLVDNYKAVCSVHAKLPSPVADGLTWAIWWCAGSPMTSLGEQYPSVINRDDLNPELATADLVDFNRCLSAALSSEFLHDQPWAVRRVQLCVLLSQITQEVAGEFLQRVDRKNMMSLAMEIIRACNEPTHPDGFYKFIYENLTCTLQ